jgi:hypothetical protein
MVCKNAEHRQIEAKLDLLIDSERKILFELNKLLDERDQLKAEVSRLKDTLGAVVVEPCPHCGQLTEDDTNETPPKADDDDEFS